jgi:glycine/D-amino acid oxidase-like deaminating enzyme
MILLLPWREALDEGTLSFADREEVITLDEERKAGAERQRKEAEEAAAERAAAGEPKEKEPELGGDESTGNHCTESCATYESHDK